MDREVAIMLMEICKRSDWERDIIQQEILDTLHTHGGLSDADYQNI